MNSSQLEIIKCILARLKKDDLEVIISDLTNYNSKLREEFYNRIKFETTYRKIKYYEEKIDRIVQQAHNLQLFFELDNSYFYDYLITKCDKLIENGVKDYKNEKEFYVIGLIIKFYEILFEFDVNYCINNYNIYPWHLYIHPMLNDEDLDCNLKKYFLERKKQVFEIYNFHHIGIFTSYISDESKKNHSVLRFYELSEDESQILDL